ncbi:sensor histidine kinase [Streptomyces sp. SP18CS02]|uniref:sensor histidine kinase n=1 Tax=Streptomyces sp. SP18CS02 TaxID=3002531 RepID=UPI002E762609|nr:histidine kinase [Streptomyces sp. SP18CS02]MEE1756659.1 histidine kinase [Streptomyces sp. SP18CS02]
MMKTQQDEYVSSAARQLENRLSAGRDEIISRFQDSLISVCSPLVSTDELWSEAREHAKLVLEECCESLRNGTDAAAAANIALSLSVGLSTRGILQTVHPADTLRSSGLLFQITLQYLINAAADLPPEQSSECLGRAVSALNHSLATCLQVSAAGYDAYLLNKVEQTANSHRKRLGRDLHDHLGNSLAMAHRYLDLHELAVEQDQPAEKRERCLARVREALDEAGDYTRGLISDLRVSTGTRRLADALREYAERHQSPDVELHIEVNGDESWLPQQHSEELFLVLREFLRNSLTHARPRTVALKVDVAPHRVDCFAHDDGDGFDMDCPSGRRGSGLASMRERTIGLDGMFFLSSTPGVGTGMRMSLPLPQGSSVRTFKEPATS